jgi:hypothetical protein
MTIPISIAISLGARFALLSLVNHESVLVGLAVVRDQVFEVAAKVIAVVGNGTGSKAVKIWWHNVSQQRALEEPSITDHSRADSCLVFVLAFSFPSRKKASQGI